MTKRAPAGKSQGRVLRAVAGSAMSMIVSSRAASPAPRQLPGVPLEGGREVGRVVVAHRVRDLRNAVFTRGEQLGRALHPALHDEPVDGDSEHLAECGFQLGLIDADEARQLRNVGWM